MDIGQVREVFGWMLVFNIGFYTLAAVFIIFARDFAVKLEARLTGVEAEKWPGIFVNYLSQYKIAILVFNLAPWLALRVVG
ncbi:unnamed protein product [Ectocarpus sp. 12 AP-2014]